LGLNFVPGTEIGVFAASLLGRVAAFWLYPVQNFWHLIAVSCDAYAAKPEFAGGFL
jgi:hypothetical protein